MFSIIIPIYNVEKYLDKCIRSVLNQTCTDWEAICINDGSTDKSLEIIEQYASNDNRIKVITQTNQGLAETRNVGIRNASGKWIIFLDSDDYLREDALEIIKNTVNEESLDAISYETNLFYDGGRKGYDNKDAWYTKNNIYQGVYKGSELFRDMMSNHEYCDSACLLCISREWLLDNDIFFYKGILYEDAIFSMTVFLKAKRMLHLSQKLYTYRVREASIMTSCITHRNLESRLIVFEEIYKMLLVYSLSEDVKRQIVAYLSIVADDIRGLDNKCVDREIHGMPDPSIELLSKIMEVGDFRRVYNEEIILDGIEKVISESNVIRIYGAGKAGKLLLFFIKAKGMGRKVASFVVSSDQRTKNYIDDIPIISVSSLNESNSTIFIAVIDRRAVYEIQNNLQNINDNVKICDIGIFRALEHFYEKKSVNERLL